MANYTGQYNDLINTSFNKLFGRNAAQAGLDYWGGALSDPNSKITQNNLEQSLISGASGDDLAWYNANVLSPKTNTPTTTYTKYPGKNSSGTNSSGIQPIDLSTAVIENPFSKSNVAQDNSNTNNQYTNSNPSQLYQGIIDGYEGKDIDIYQPGTVNSGISLADVEPYRPNESDTVQGRMDGLLASGSQYMQNARASGERTAQSRGLLNSSLAAGSSQKAAIEAALPIAQQDSQSMVDAGMTGYQARIDAAQSLQDHNEALEAIQSQASASSYLSKQEADQALRYAEFAGLLQSGVSAQDAAQEANLSAQEAAQTMALENSQNSAASDLSYQEYLQNSNQSLIEGQISSGLSSQGFDQDMQLDWQQQAGANYRTEVEADINEALKTMELASTEKRALADSMTTFGEKFQNDVTGINADETMNDDEKTKAISVAQDLYTSNMQTLSGLFGVELDWDGTHIQEAEEPIVEPDLNDDTTGKSTTRSETEQAIWDMLSGGK